MSKKTPDDDKEINAGLEPAGACSPLVEIWNRLAGGQRVTRQTDRRPI